METIKPMQQEFGKSKQKSKYYRQQPFAAMGADVVKSSAVLLSTFVHG
jgi:hypothetical protein